MNIIKAIAEYTFALAVVGVASTVVLATPLFIMSAVVPHREYHQPTQPVDHYLGN